MGKLYSSKSCLEMAGGSFGTMPPPLNTLLCTEHVDILLMTQNISTPSECNTPHSAP